MASIYSRLTDAVKSLIGVSQFADHRPYSGPEIDAPQVVAVREALGGNLQPLPLSETRWYMADLELCQQMADAGDISKIGRLCRAMRRDGVISGLTSTRTAGMIALPKRWRGNQSQIEQLQSTNGTRTVFDEMVPPGELAKIAADAIKCGVGVGELCPMVGRKHPRLVALEPEFLRWKQAEGRWYFQSVGGSVPITPGDGRWVLHVEGGLLAPWNNGAWSALGRAYITKETALLARSNFSQKLANPARYAKTAQGATEVERAGFLEALIRWGFNTTFELPPGWEVGILETNGRGWEVFGTDIDTANFESMVALAGQIVTTTGGSGFANADIHRTIRADLIKTSADALAHTINTQILPPWAFAEYGESGLEDIARVEWDVKPPEDRKVEAEALEAVAKAVVALVGAFKAEGIKIDAQEIASRFGVPVELITAAQETQLAAQAQAEQGGQPSPAASPPQPAPPSAFAAIAHVGPWRAGDWDESKHPRSDDGKFGTGGGGGSSSDKSDDEEPDPRAPRENPDAPRTRKELERRHESAKYRLEQATQQRDVAEKFWLTTAKDILPQYDGALEAIDVHSAHADNALKAAEALGGKRGAARKAKIEKQLPAYKAGLTTMREQLLIQREATLRGDRVTAVKAAKKGRAAEKAVAKNYVWRDLYSDDVASPEDETAKTGPYKGEPIGGMMFYNDRFWQTDEHNAKYAAQAKYDLNRQNRLVKMYQRDVARTDPDRKRG